MCWLYLGTFGSFIGFAAGFPLLIKSQFPHVNALQYAWLGPLVGAVMRPFGGWLADKLGGARVTFWVFVVMALGCRRCAVFPADQRVGRQLRRLLRDVPAAVPRHRHRQRLDVPHDPGDLPDRRQRAAAGRGAQAEEQAIRDGNKEAAAVLGFSGAIGAYGGFFIPKSYGTSIELTGGPEGALYAFIVFYLSCIVTDLVVLRRRNAPMPC